MEWSIPTSFSGKFQVQPAKISREHFPAGRAWVKVIIDRGRYSLIVRCQTVINDDALSETLATVLLISIIALGISLFAVAIFSQPPPDDVPATKIEVRYAEDGSGSFSLYHNGGDPIRKEDVTIYVDEGSGRVDRTNGLTLNGQPWEVWRIGESLDFTSTLGRLPGVVIIYAGSSASSLLFSTGTFSSGGGSSPEGVTSPPKAGFSADILQGMAPLTVQFTDESAGNPMVWLWKFGDYAQSETQGPTHTYGEGTYNVSLTVYNAYGSNTMSRPQYIYVYNEILVNFTADTAIGFAPLTVQFTDESTGNPNAWNWSFGDGAFGEEKNPMHTYANPGLYTVTLVASNPWGTRSKTVTGYIDVGEPICPDFTAAPTGGVFPLNVQFTDTSSGTGITSWTWDLDNDGRTDGTARNPSHTYGSPGTYNVNLTIGNKYGENSTVKAGYITVTDRQVIFYEDFEDGASGWSTSGLIEVNSDNPRIGSQSLKLYCSAFTDSSSVTRTIPTTGYKDIVVSFDMGAENIDSRSIVEDDWFKVSWSAGGSPQTPVNLGHDDDDGQLHHYEVALPVTADNNPNFKLKFEIFDGALILKNAKGFVDNITVTGIPLLPAPTVTGITPNQGQRGTTVAITNLTGAGFESGTAVKLTNEGNTIAATGVAVVNGNEITCSFPIPAGAALGPWNVVATDAYGRSGTFTNGFAVTAPAPTVIGIAPGSGITGTTAGITNLAGSNFLTGATVKLMKAGQSDIAATGVSVVNANKITCSFDLNGAAAGTWNVVVTNPDGQSATLTERFTVVYPAPTISNINPDDGLRGATVSIKNLAGTGFLNGATVKLTRSGQSDITATGVDVVSDRKITCSFSIPVGAAWGAWNIVVTNPDGQSNTLTNGFTITLPPPTISGITPNQGGRGTTVAITDLAGTGFESGTIVKLTKSGRSGIVATDVTVVDNNKVTCSFPIPTSSSTGWWRVVVTNPDGQSATLNKGFEILTPHTSTLTVQAKERWGVLWWGWDEGFVPVNIAYSGAYHSGSDTTQFEFERTTLGDSGFTVTLTAPATISDSGTWYFKRWRIGGSDTYSNPVTVTVPDAGSMTATVYYQEQ